MNTKNILLTGLVGAVITLLLTNIPFVNLINCLVCSGFWVGPLFAVWLYKRMTGTVSLKEGIWIGVTAGVIAGVVGFLLSFVGLAGATGFVNDINMLVPEQDQIDLSGIGGEIGSIVFTFFGIIFDIVVGAIGGYVGTAIFRPKNQTRKEAGNEQGG
jgi:hypothetical protein